MHLASATPPVTFTDGPTWSFGLTAMASTGSDDVFELTGVTVAALSTLEGITSVISLMGSIVTISHMIKSAAVPTIALTTLEGVASVVAATTTRG